jgi:hypothetical protein
MPIRNVVTRGYSNGTFSLGIITVSTRGYTIGSAVGTIGYAVAGMAYIPGVQAVQIFIAGAKDGEAYLPGGQKGIDAHVEL